MKDKRISRIIKDLLLATFLLAMATSCLYDTVSPKPVDVPDTVSFSVDIIPIFNSNCNSAGCHNTGGIPPDLSEERAWVSLVFGGYVDTANAETSLLYTKILPGQSMAPFATDEHRALILAWIEQGAQDN